MFLPEPRKAKAAEMTDPKPTRKLTAAEKEEREIEVLADRIEARWEREQGVTRRPQPLTPGSKATAAEL